eukprot:1914430-Rhodomonas_salina.1
MKFATNTELSSEVQRALALIGSEVHFYHSTKNKIAMVTEGEGEEARLAMDRSGADKFFYRMIHARLARVIGGAESSQSATGILEPLIRDAIWETLTLLSQLTSLVGKLVQIESMEIPERMRTEILTLKEQIKSPPNIQTVIGDILADTNRGTIQRSLTEVAMADSTGPTERTEFIRLAYDLHVFWVLQSKAEAMNTPDLPVLVRS